MDSNINNHIAKPRHVAIIMDGSGRWATERGKARRQGHLAGSFSVEKAIIYASQEGIESLSLYAFSKENWKRPKAEVDNLMKLLLKALKKKRKLFATHNVKVNPIGDLKAFTPEIQEGLASLVEETKNNTGTILNVCLNYSGQWDIARACSQLYQEELTSLENKIASKIASCGKIEEAELGAIFAEYKAKVAKVDALIPELDTRLCVSDQAPIDLIIRTSNELRLSNFFLWQASYSEFLFLKEHWPDFDEKSFEKAIKEFSSRKRRFGGLDKE